MRTREQLRAAMCHAVPAAIIAVCGVFVSRRISHPVAPLVAGLGLVVAFVLIERAYLVLLQFAITGQKGPMRPSLWLWPMGPLITLCVVVLIEISSSLLLAPFEGFLSAFMALLSPLVIGINLSLILVVLFPSACIAPAIIDMQSSGSAPRLGDVITRVVTMFRADPATLFIDRISSIATQVGIWALAVLVSALSVLPASGGYVARILYRAVLGDAAAVDVSAHPLVAILVASSLAVILGLTIALSIVVHVNMNVRLYTRVAHAPDMTEHDI